MQNDYEFARLVYQLVIVEKSKNLTEIATALNLNYDAMHSRVNNRVHFKPGEIREILKILPDSRLVMHFLKETPFVIAERADPDPETDSEDVMSLTHRSLFQIVEVLKKVRESLDDGLIDHRERLQLLGDIETTEIALASLKEAVEALQY
jgi:DNA gyrase/topoisomerase IV subunit A